MEVFQQTVLSLIFTPFGITKYITTAKLISDESNNISFFILIFKFIFNIISIYNYHHTNFMSLNIGVFLGSKLGDDKKIQNLIKKFSEWFIKHNHTLIIGGTNSGLMQILAEEVYKKVNVKAIYTQQSIDSSKNYDFYTDLIIVNNSIKKRSF